MVHRTPGLSPCHQTCTQKDTCSHGHAIKTTRSRQRRRRQHRCHAPPRTHICQTSRQTKPRVDLDRETSPTGTTKTTTAHERVAQPLSTWIRQVSYGTIYTVCLWKHEGKMVFPPNDKLKWDLLHLIHDKLTAAHTGWDWTIYTAKRVAWWPAMSKWVKNYVRGCTKCQQNKTLTHWIPTPQYKINVPPYAQPFKIVSMDLITQLPNSHRYDAILTIVDHGCTRADPCSTYIKFVPWCGHPYPYTVHTRWVCCPCTNKLILTLSTPVTLLQVLTGYGPCLPLNWPPLSIKFTLYP